MSKGKSETTAGVSASGSNQGGSKSATVNTEVKHSNDRVTFFAGTESKFGGGKPEHTGTVGVNIKLGPK